MTSMGRKPATIRIAAYKSSPRYALRHALRHALHHERRQWHLAIKMIINKYLPCYHKYRYPTCSHCKRKRLIHAQLSMYVYPLHVSVRSVTKVSVQMYISLSKLASLNSLQSAVAILYLYINIISLTTPCPFLLHQSKITHNSLYIDTSIISSCQRLSANSSLSTYLCPVLSAHKSLLSAHFTHQVYQITNKIILLPLIS